MYVSIDCFSWVQAAWNDIQIYFYKLAFLFVDPERVPARFAEINADHKRMLDTLTSPKYQSLDWIAVCPPHIADEPSSNGQFKINHGSSPGRQIPKWDLGLFMFDCLSQPEHYRQQCGLAYPILS